MYALKNKPQFEMTAAPDKYPQKRFNPKRCRRCGTEFSPNAPSHLYCSQDCADWGLSNRYLQRTYGIGFDEYRQMLEEQDSKCKICRGHGFKISPTAKTLLVVDHNHSTGEVRGLLCHNCNRGLGLFQDDPKLLEEARAYLCKKN